MPSCDLLHFVDGCTNRLEEFSVQFENDSEQRLPDKFVSSIDMSQAHSLCSCRFVLVVFQKRVKGKLISRAFDASCTGFCVIKTLPPFVLVRFRIERADLTQLGEIESVSVNCSYCLRDLEYVYSWFFFPFLPFRKQSLDLD